MPEQLTLDLYPVIPTDAEGARLEIGDKVTCLGFYGDKLTVRGITVHDDREVVLHLAPPLWGTVYRPAWMTRKVTY